MTSLKLLDGVIDIYMPDIKYGNSETAHRYSRIRDYVAINHAAVREMHQQVGNLVLDAAGIAQRGLLIRHLVLPGLLDETKLVLDFIAREISAHSYLNLMDQYRPAYKIHNDPALNRPLSATEYQAALKMAQDAGLRRLDHRRSRLFFL